MSKRITQSDRDFAQGVAVALGIVQSAHGQTTAVVEALRACGYTRAKLKRYGVDDHDLNLLAPAFRDMRP